MPWDAEFHAFGKLNKLIELFIPVGHQHSVAQANAIHECARVIAEDLTSGDFVYNATRHKEIPCRIRLPL